MKIQTLAIAGGCLRPCGTAGVCTGIGELQAALAANASLNSWLEAQGTQTFEVIALGVATDGSLAVFTTSSPT